MTFKIKQLLKYCVSLVLLILIFLAGSVIYALNNNASFTVQGQSAPHLIIENAQIVDPLTDELLTRSLLIRNGIIQQVTDTLIPRQENELRIDGRGLFVSPGLIDMHVHIYDRTDLLLNLAHGVTTVRNMHGMPHHFAYRKAMTIGKLSGPELIISSPIINQRSGYVHGNHHWFPDNEQQAIDWIRRFNQQGYDVIKVYDGLNEKLLNAIIDEAQILNMPVAGHPPFDIPFEQFVTAPLQTIEHSEMLFQAPLNYSYDQAPLSELIETLVSANSVITPTLYNFHELALLARDKQNFLRTLNIEFVNPTVKDLLKGGPEWAMSLNNSEPLLRKSQYMGELTFELHKAGVPLVLGSDAGAGFTLNGDGAIRELSRLRDIGIPAADLLTIGVSNGANALGHSHRIGQIKNGFEADLILTQSNPKDNVATYWQVQGVINNGEYYNADAVKLMKQQAKNHMSFYELFGWYLLDQYNRLALNL